MIQMKNHFNSMIKQLNQIAVFVNQKHGYRIIEETAEFDHGFDEIDRVPPHLLIAHVTKSITSDLT